MTAANVHFYRHLTIDRFAGFAARAGLDGCVDLELCFPLVERARVLVELGAGYGRVLSGLLARRFQGEIYAVERVPELSAYLRARFGAMIRTLEGDALHLDLPERADAVLWLWAGIVEQGPEEQAAAIKRIGGDLRPGGVLVVETPHGPLRIIGERRDAHVVRAETEWGTLDAWIPLQEDMERMSGAAGFASCETIPYRTTTGLDRRLYVLRRPYGGDQGDAGRGAST